MIASRGLSNTRWSASVSSTTPRLGERCPPVSEMCSIRNSRISVARVSSCDADRPRRSAGDLIVSSKDVSLTVRLTGLGSHQFRQLNADPGPSAGGRPGDRRQVALVVPGAGGDVEVDPRLAFDELLDEHAAGY